MTVATGPVTLFVEQLLRHPDYTRIITNLRRNMPAHQRDQADAAANHTRRIMATIPGYTHNHMAFADAPDWLLLGAVDAIVTYATGKATTCRHATNPDAPLPVAAAAWKPGHIACLRCPWILQLPAGSDADRTCDACGRICAGTEHSDPIYPSAAQVFRLIYQVGVCTGCRFSQHPA